MAAPRQSRPVTLFTGQWADLPLAELAERCRTWGYDGLELACWGDHFEVDRALADDAYCRDKRALLDQHGLGCWALGAHLVGQAVCDPIDARHQAILPPEVWGDGEPDGVRARAAEGARLEIAYVLKGASRVQIPPSPLSLLRKVWESASADSQTAEDP